MPSREQFVRCPTCGKKVKWSTESKWRPFCSKRCKLIDLGDWIAEKHRIQGEEEAPDDSNPHN